MAKRCKATSPQTGRRCTKKRSHVRKDIDVVHQNGMMVWGDKDQYPTRAGLVDGLATGGLVKLTSPSPLDMTPEEAAKRKEAAAGRPRPTAEIVADERTVITFGSEALPGLYETTMGARFKSDFESRAEPDPHQALIDWWMGKAATEAERTIPKAIEYSSTDLTDIGHDLARTMGREVSDEEAAELGVFFYLRGKVARWVGAVIAGQRVSDDTLFDIGVYVRMAQRIRATGGWPGIKEGK